MLSECIKSNKIKLDKSKELLELKEVLENHNEYLKQKQETRAEEYLEFLSFLCENENWDNELIIIRKENWDEFYNTDDEDYEMKIAGWTQASEFENMFEKLFGIGAYEFENNFVGSKYLDTYTYNTVELMIKINDIEEVFIIDAV
jgi:beta-N-acetylglucosaminidase